MAEMQLVRYWFHKAAPNSASPSIAPFGQHGIVIDEVARGNDQLLMLQWLVRHALQAQGSGSTKTLVSTEGEGEATADSRKSRTGPRRESGSTTRAGQPRFWQSNGTNTGTGKALRTPHGAHYRANADFKQQTSPVGICHAPKTTSAHSRGKSDRLLRSWVHLRAPAGFPLCQSRPQARADAHLAGVFRRTGRGAIRGMRLLREWVRGLATDWKLADGSSALVQFVTCRLSRVRST